MAGFLEQAVEVMRQMPQRDQDSIAQAILTVARGGAPLDIEPEHLPFILEGLAQLRRGEFVEGEPAELVDAAFRRHQP